jgi:hypothetical protein
MSIRVLVLLIGVVAIGNGAALAATAPLMADPGEQIFDSKPKGTTADTTVGANPGLAKPPATAEPAPSGNPLWAIPLTSLTATRDRPLFSPSRRPPPPVMAAKPAAPPPPPPKPAEPEKPQLSLVGTVVAQTGEGIGLFVNADDRTPLRLKTGENHKGWVLREVRPRQVVLEKGQQIAVLEFPRRDANKPASVPPASVPPAAALPAAPPAPTAVLPAAPANPATKAVVDEVAATSSAPIDNPKARGGFSPPRDTGSQPTVAPTIIVQPPAIVFPEPQVNPFQQKTRLH